MKKVCVTYDKMERVKNENGMCYVWHDWVRDEEGMFCVTQVRDKEGILDVWQDVFLTIVCENFEFPFVLRIYFLYQESNL